MWVVISSTLCQLYLLLWRRNCISIQHFQMSSSLTLVFLNITSRIFPFFNLDQWTAAAAMNSHLEVMEKLGWWWIFFWLVKISDIRDFFWHLPNSFVSWPAALIDLGTIQVHVLVFVFQHLWQIFFQLTWTCLPRVLPRLRPCQDCFE